MQKEDAEIWKEWLICLLAGKDRWCGEEEKPTISVLLWCAANSPRPRRALRTPGRKDGLLLPGLQLAELCAWTSGKL